MTHSHSLEHTWKHEYYYDEGCGITCHLRLCLYYSPVLEKYVVSGRRADFTTGRHWNRDGIPDQLFRAYSDALQAYLVLAKRYAPDDVIERVKSDVATEMQKEEER